MPTRTVDRTDARIASIMRDGQESVSIALNVDRAIAHSMFSLHMTAFQEALNFAVHYPEEAAQILDRLRSRQDQRSQEASTIMAESTLHLWDEAEQLEIDRDMFGTFFNYMEMVEENNGRGNSPEDAEDGHPSEQERQGTRTGYH